MATFLEKYEVGSLANKRAVVDAVRHTLFPVITALNACDLTTKEFSLSSCCLKDTLENRISAKCVLEDIVNVLLIPYKVGYLNNDKDLVHFSKGITFCCIAPMPLLILDFPKFTEAFFKMSCVPKYLTLVGSYLDEAHAFFEENTDSETFEKEILLEDFEGEPGFAVAEDEDIDCFHDLMKLNDLSIFIKYLLSFLGYGAYAAYSSDVFNDRVVIVIKREPDLLNN